MWQRIVDLRKNSKNKNKKCFFFFYMNVLARVPINALIYNNIFSPKRIIKKWIFNIYRVIYTT